MANLDQILNTTIPILVIFVFIALIYYKMKEPINHLLGIIWNWLKNAGGNTQNVVYETTYE